MERRLSAILAADVAGYSRLMEQDEAATFERLRTHRKGLVEPEIAAHHGRIFKLMGDGLLAEFGSVVDALECAAALQRGMAERTRDEPAEQRIEVRIGVHLGDVMIEGEDRHGDAVNVAARLQQLAEPGGICVSHTVVDHARHKVTLGFEPRGEVRLKNMAEPVAVYRVAIDGVAKSKRSVPVRKVRRFWAPAAALAALLLLATGGAAAWYFYPRDHGPSGPPSIAVLPFVNMSGDPADNYLGEGLAEDVITELSTFPTLKVASRTSSFVYDEPENIQKVARELGVTYVLEGSVRRAADKLRVTAQLIDGTTGEHVWADRYDDESGNVVALQEGVARKIYASLAGFEGEIQNSAARESWSKSAPSLEEYDYYLRGHALFFKNTPEDNLRAREIWQEGLERFPDSALLRSKIVFSYTRSLFREWTDDPTGDMAIAWKLGTEAQAIERKSRLATWLGHWTMAYLHQWHKGDFERSAAEAEAAIAMVPRDPGSLSDLSWFMANAGKLDKAIEWGEEASRLQPDGPEWTHANLAWAYYLADRPADALVELEKLSDPWGFNLAAVYVRLGRLEEAKAAVAKVREQWPDWRVRDELIWPTYNHPTAIEPLRQAYADDLLAAGAKY